MKVGYIRVSTEEQNSARQEVLMEELGVEKVYIDKASGKNSEREKLQEMLTFVREGDEVIVKDISRFARSTRDLLDLVAQLEEKNVKFVSLKENIDTSTPTGKFMLTVFAAIAELDRETILANQKEGIAIAKAQGKYKGRVPIKFDKELFIQEYKRWKNAETTATLMMKKLNLKRNTFYRRVREYEVECGIIKEANNEGNHS